MTQLTGRRKKPRLSKTIHGCQTIDYYWFQDGHGYTAAV